MLGNEWRGDDPEISQYVGKHVTVTGYIGASDTLGVFGPLYLEVVSIVETTNSGLAFEVAEDEEVALTGTWRSVEYEWPPGTGESLTAFVIDFGSERTYSISGSPLLEAGDVEAFTMSRMAVLGILEGPAEGSLVTVKGRAGLGHTYHHLTPIVLFECEIV